MEVVKDMVLKTSSSPFSKRSSRGGSGDAKATTVTAYGC